MDVYLALDERTPPGQFLTILVSGCTSQHNQLSQVLYRYLQDLRFSGVNLGLLTTMLVLPCTCSTSLITSIFTPIYTLMLVCEAYKQLSVNQIACSFGLKIRLEILEIGCSPEIYASIPVVGLKWWPLVTVNKRMQLHSTEITEIAWSWKPVLFSANFRNHVQSKTVCELISNSVLQPSAYHRYSRCLCIQVNRCTCIRWVHQYRFRADMEKTRIRRSLQQTYDSAIIQCLILNCQRAFYDW